MNDETLYHAVFNTGLFCVDTIVEAISTLLSVHVTKEKEAEGKVKINDFLTAQKAVNLIQIENKLNITFLRAEVVAEKTILLHGVSESSDIVSKAIELVKENFKDYKIKSAIGISQDYKVRIR